MNKNNDINYACDLGTNSTSFLFKKDFLWQNLVKSVFLQLTCVLTNSLSNCFDDM